MTRAHTLDPSMTPVPGRTAETRHAELPEHRPNGSDLVGDEARAFESVWPRRFDAAEVTALLGVDADQLVGDVLAQGVNAPLWNLADRGGKRWRPAVSRLAFLVSGGRAPVPAPICQVVELLHTGSLVVDDIQDGAQERRSGPAAHVVHGVPTALNAANAAYFRALEILRRCLADGPRLRALDMLAEELFIAHLGQALDLALCARQPRTRLRTAHYFVLARAKTGALVRMAARLGSIAANGTAACESALGAWASELGVAYQIANDLDDVAGGMQDVVTRRPSYPLLLALEDDGPAAQALRARADEGTMTPHEAAELRRLFARERIAERGRAAARLAGRRALAALDRLPASTARAELEHITHGLMP
jgi:geranylgeranyl diphosphate synthase type I